jgi:hypothetical protein
LAPLAWSTVTPMGELLKNALLDALSLAFLKKLKATLPNRRSESGEYATCKIY